MVRRKSSGPRAVSGEISTTQSGCPLAWHGTGIPASFSQRTARSTWMALLVAEVIVRRADKAPAEPGWIVRGLVKPGNGQAILYRGLRAVVKGRQEAVIALTRI